MDAGYGRGNLTASGIERLPAPDLLSGPRCLRLIRRRFPRIQPGEKDLVS